VSEKVCVCVCVCVCACRHYLTLSDGVSHIDLHSVRVCVFECVYESERDSFCVRVCVCVCVCL